MVIYFLGIEEVRSYIRELVQRLALANPVPEIWCPLTQSGQNLLPVLIDMVKHESPELVDRVTVIPMSPEDKPKGKIKAGQGRTPGFLFGDSNPESVFKGRSVFLFDSTIHGGSTMCKAAAELKRLGAARVCTYTLVLKSGSLFIPTLWGLMINDQDRAYFLLDRTPNNRLTTSLTEQQPYVNFQKLSDKNVQIPPINTGVISMDRVTWGDRLFDMSENTQGRCTYLLESDEKMVGYLTVHWGDNQCLHIDEVAADTAEQGKGFGGVLIRFAETLARQSACRHVRLNAIENRVDWYKKFDYSPVPGRKMICLENEKYQPMEKVVLYHQMPSR